MDAIRPRVPFSPRASICIRGVTLLLRATISGTLSSFTIMFIRMGSGSGFGGCCRGVSLRSKNSVFPPHLAAHGLVLIGGEGTGALSDGIFPESSPEA